MFQTLDNEHRQLIKSEDRNGDERQREDIGRRRDHSRNDQNDDKGMTAITCHERRLQQSGLGQKPRQHRQLEHDAHEQQEQEEGVDVGIEGNEIWHIAADLI